MNLITRHYQEIVAQDFLYKSHCKTLDFLPKITKITLSANFSPIYKGNILSLFDTLTFYKSYLSQSKTNVLSLGIRKGDPVGIKLCLRKNSIYDFLIYFLFEILPRLKEFEGFKINSKSKSLDYQFKDLSILDETNYIYIYFTYISGFDLVINGNNLNPNFFMDLRLPVNL
jgi:large subunit ribosomal protein L5